MFHYLSLIIQSICEFLPISSSTIINFLATNIYQTYVNTVYLGILHCFTGIVGLAFYYDELLLILKNKKKLYFLIWTIFGFSIGFLLLYLSYGSEFLYIAHEINAFFYIKHIFQGLVLHYIINYFPFDLDDFIPHEKSIKYYGIAFLGGVIMWVSFLSGTSRLTGLLLVLRFAMSLEESFKYAVLVSSGVNIASLLFFLIKTPAQSLDIIKSHIIGLPIVFIIGGITLYIMNRFIKQALIISNAFRVVLFSIFFIKYINIVHKIILLIEKNISKRFLCWIYGICGGFLGNMILITLGLKYVNDNNIIGFLCLIGVVTIIVDLIIIKCLSFLYESEIKQFLNNNIVKKYINNKPIIYCFNIFYRFIPFTRILSLSLGVTVLTQLEMYILNIIGGFMWVICFYFFKTRNLFGWF